MNSKCESVVFTHPIDNFISQNSLFSYSPMVVNRKLWAGSWSTHTSSTRLWPYPCQSSFLRTEEWGFILYLVSFDKHPILSELHYVAKSMWRTTLHYFCFSRYQITKRSISFDENHPLTAIYWAVKHSFNHLDKNIPFCKIIFKPCPKLWHKFWTCIPRSIKQIP